ncbi:MAG: hypothetical protein R3248_14525, partial [Candidatus Promineifilaceae bacterium]|nr:hypothetical protein [Candidatus Promineifilaceae bacterium]
RRSACLLGGLLLCWLLVACGQPAGALPTKVAAAALTPAAGDGVVPPTWTAAPPPTATSKAAPALASTPTPSRTPLPIPTITPFTPPPTFTPSPVPLPETRITPDRLPLGAYGPDEAIQLAAFPRPPGDNGWGVHWIPTVKQEPAVVDRFVAEVVKMHIKWVVFLNDGTNVGDNDYLVRKLVANDIMPVMRLYRSTITPYDGDLGAVVRHYRSLGVYYFQLYNEPNVNVENHQGFANPIHYAAVWAEAAREVIANGGLPGFGALSPGGAYDHYEFLDRTLRTLEHNGDLQLLNRAWLSVHNYHGTRPYNDPDGFLLFRKYDAIVRSHLLRSMAMIGTEGGSYSDNPEVVKNHLAYQYRYMRDAEPYLLAYSYWLLANEAGGSHDSRWEYQALFREGYVHPVVPDFFYLTSQ